MSPSVVQYRSGQGLQLADGFVQRSQRLQQNVVCTCVNVLCDPLGDIGLIAPRHYGVHQPIASAPGHIFVGVAEVPKPESTE